MDFNTMLQSDVSYNRPVEQPSMMAGLANILSSAMDTGPQREPTKDEKFTMTLKAYQDNNPALRSTDAAIRTKAIRDLTPEFLVNNPGFVSEYKSWSESLGAGIEVTLEDTVKDAETKATETFLQTPKGQLAAATAEAEANKDGVYKPDVYQKLITNSRLEDAATKVKLERLKNDTEAGAAKDVIASNYYKATTLEAEKIVSSSMLAMQDTLERAINGETVDLPPELAARLGVKQINSTNIYSVMVASRPFLVGQINDQLVSSFTDSGADPSLFTAGPPEDITKGWMAGYDIMLESVKNQSGDPSATLKTVTDVYALNALKTMSPSQIAGLAIIGRLPPEVRQSAASTLINREFSTDKIDELVAKVTINATSNRPVQDILIDITNGSLNDAKGILDTSMAMLGTNKLEGTQFTQTLTTALAANARTQSNASLGKDTFDTLFVKNAEHIKVQAAADPEFSSYVAGEVLSDINKTLEAAKISGASSQLDVTIVNGKVVVELSESAKIGYGIAGGMGGGGGTVAPPIENLYTPEIKALQLKLDSLTGLGDVGKQVSDAFSVGTQKPVEGLTQPETVFTFDKSLVPTNGEIIKIGQAEIVTNSAMKPLLTSMEGASQLTVKGADQVMAGMLQGPFQKLQTTFGKPLTINDGIAKGGTTREKETKGSRHFHGDALDISITGMSNEEQMKLVDAALAAGFQGFGFGKGILHVDLGSKRAWAYGNTSFGGTSIEKLKMKISGSKVAAATITTDPREQRIVGDVNTPETDPKESKPSSFSLIGSNYQTPVGEAPSLQTPEFAATETTTTTPQAATEKGATATSATTAVGKEAQALVASLGAPDATYTTTEEFQVAAAAGKFTAGDVILVDGVTYVIRRDGTPVKVGG